MIFSCQKRFSRMSDFALLHGVSERVAWWWLVVISDRAWLHSLRKSQFYLKRRAKLIAIQLPEQKPPSRRGTAPPAVDINRLVTKHPVYTVLSAVTLVPADFFKTVVLSHFYATPHPLRFCFSLTSTSTSLPRPPSTALKQVHLHSTQRKTELRFFYRKYKQVWGLWWTNRAL